MAKGGDSQKAFRDWINATVPIFPLAATHRLIRRADLARDTQVFCPFHPNTDTPAAKIYMESNNLHCFVCQRNYGAWDFLVTLENMTYGDLLAKYGEQFGEHQRDQLKAEKADAVRSLLDDAKKDPALRRTLENFQVDVIGSALATPGYVAWKAGTGNFQDMVDQMDDVLTNGFSGYDYAAIARGERTA